MFLVLLYWVTGKASLIRKYLNRNLTEGANCVSRGEFQAEGTASAEVSVEACWRGYSKKAGVAKTE